MRKPFSAGEAMLLVPGSKLLLLPSRIDLTGHAHAWAWLYDWVQRQLPRTQARTLPNALVIGEEAMRELLELERTRLNRSGLEGVLLERALVSTNLNAGPNTLLYGRALEGRWLLVRPSR